MASHPTSSKPCPTYPNLSATLRRVCKTHFLVYDYKFEVKENKMNLEIYKLNFVLKCMTNVNLYAIKCDILEI